MELADVVADLYAGDPDDFVARRKLLAAEARAAKDRTLAADILALRRPTRGAWLVNLLARTDADGLGQLLDLGPALAEAHTAGSPAGLRELTSLRRRIVASLVDRAVGLGLHRGYDATPAVRDEVARALDAALADPGTAAVVRQGALDSVPETAAAFPTHLFAGRVADADSNRQAAVPGSRALDGPAVRGVEGRSTPADATPADKSDQKPASKVPAVPVAELRAILRRVEQAAEAAGEALAGARDDVAAASAEVETARRATVQARARAGRAEKDEGQAAAAVEAARAALATAEQALADAQAHRVEADEAVTGAEADEAEAADALDRARAREAEAGAEALRTEADVVDARANLDRATG